MREGLRRWVPPLAEAPFEEAWAGMIDTTPDVVPVMDEVPAWPGLFVATGFSGHGFSRRGFNRHAPANAKDEVNPRPPHALTIGVAGPPPPLDTA